MLAQKSSVDDPEEDRTVTVVAPNSVKEEGLVIWLVQNKRISARQANFIQMDDDLANEFSIYAQDDDEQDHQALAQAELDANTDTAKPTFFESTVKDGEEVAKPVQVKQFNEVGEKMEETEEVPKKVEETEEAPKKVEEAPKP